MSTPLLGVPEFTELVSVCLRLDNMFSFVLIMFKHVKVILIWI